MSQERRGHYAKWKKPILKGHVWCDSICRPSSKLQDYGEGEHIYVCQGVRMVDGESQKEVTVKHERQLGGDEKLCILIVVMVTRIYT